MLLNCGICFSIELTKSRRNNMVKLNIELPEGYLNKEERDGYLVTTETKQLWAVLLDILCQIDTICKKHDIQYFLCGGTLLGAVRHKGFIPWDDDLDIMMKRNDYNRFCEIAPSELKNPYFFQSERTDPGHLLRHAKIRNSNTTGMFKSFAQKGYNINQGIFVDVFPLDNLPDDENERKRYYDELYKVWGKVWKHSAFKNRHVRFELLENIKINFENSILDIFGMSDYYNSMFEKLAGKYKDAITKECCLILGHLTPKGLKNTHKWETKDYEQFTITQFEFLQLPIPLNYDAQLTTLYGDWHKIVMGATSHGELIIDVDKPYSYYK